MSFIEMDLEEVKEAENAPEGEYDLRIVNVVEKQSSKGKPMIVVTTEIEGHPEENYRSINTFLSLPTEDDTPDIVHFKKLGLKRFLTLFDIPIDGGFNVEDLLGASASALVTLSEPNDEGAVFNQIKVPMLDQ